MSITEENWRELETPQHTPGRSMRRIHAESAHDIHIAVTYPQRKRMLVLDTDDRAYERAATAYGRLPRTQGLELAFTRLTRQHYELTITLTSDSLKNVFTPLVMDIAWAISQATDDVGAVTTAINQFERWQTLLKSLGEDGLGADARRGLYGELLVLKDYVIPELGPANGILGWTGPLGTNQDFQLTDCAIEVKATTARATSEITIANERQLDRTGTADLVFGLVVLDERRGGLGTSLNAMVEGVRAALPGPPQAGLEGRLARIGYFPQHTNNYDEPRYTLREIRFWSVHGDFPRIVESEFRPGVSTCSYRIQTAGLDAYAITKDEVRKLIRGSHG
ncbi:PD-(D/E)XK motif protein [Actinomadura sp. GTD37]|uniref:PD-(D/E)XK motif protein n=1 Tax=Actinomadura sp. GTD37 TaxID=1778030 RepID=UPI0035BEC1C3